MFDEATWDDPEMVFRFGDVTVDPRAHELLIAGEKVDVQPQVFDVLVHLIENRDRVVSKEELLDEIWTTRFVTESALTSRIKSARQAIGDNGRDQAMIRTVHGRGYRFVAELAGDGERPPPDLIDRSAGLGSWATDFVGRREELDRLAALLSDPDRRLVNVVAPGGMGKTRLAAAAVELVGEEFADGVVEVSCAPLDHADRIPEVIAAARRLEFGDRGDLLVSLVGYLSGRSILVVLDNLEHLDVADVVRQLLGVSGPTILATSRERIGLAAEAVVSLSGLDEGDSADAAVELFVAVASAAGNPPGPTDTATIGRIVDLVGRMPLAVELAAGWTGLLPLERIEAELRGGMELLVTDLADVEDRHRSVEGLIRASWDRLDPTERAVFSRLAVFRGPVGIDAAAAVAGADLQVLRSLVARSMVAATGDGRFGVHELLRRFGRRQLEAAGDAAAARQAHTDHHLSWLSGLSAELRGTGQIAAARAITHAIHDVGDAWIRACGERRFEALDATLESLWRWADIRGGAGELEQLVTAGRDAARGCAAEDARAAAVGARLAAFDGLLAAQKGDLERGASLAGRGLADLNALDDPLRREAEIAVAQLWAGWIAFLRSQNTQAAHAAADAEQRFAAAGDTWGLARCRLLTGNNDTALGRLGAAQASLDTAEDYARSVGDDRTLSFVVRNKAILSLWFGRYGEAADLLAHSHRLAERFDDRLGVAYALREMGKLAVAEGRSDEALEVLTRSIAVTDSVGADWESAATLEDLGMAHLAAGSLTDATDAVATCLEWATRLGNRYYLARCRGDLGLVALRTGESELAGEHLAEARSLWLEIGHEPYLAWVLLRLGELGDLVELERGLELARRHEVWPTLVDGVATALSAGVVADPAAAGRLADVARSHPAASADSADRLGGRSDAAASDAELVAAVDELRRALS